MSLTLINSYTNFARHYTVYSAVTEQGCRVVSTTVSTRAGRRVAESCILWTNPPKPARPPGIHRAY